MNKPTSGWNTPLYTFIGIDMACLLGLLIAIAIGISTPQLPADLIGPLLCPTSTQTHIATIRAEEIFAAHLACTDAEGQTLATFHAQFILLWSAIFALPLILITLPIIAKLRHYNDRPTSIPPITTSFGATPTTQNTPTHDPSPTETRQTIGRFTTKTYVSTNINDIPPEARQAFEHLSRAFTDTDHDGIPDIFQHGTAQVIDLTTGTPIGGDTPLHSLQQLKSMLDAGLISQQEYEHKKTDILSRM